MYYSDLKKERVFIVQIIYGDGKADDGFAVDRHNAATERSFELGSRRTSDCPPTTAGGSDNGEFNAAFDAELIQLRLYCFEKCFWFGVVLDCYYASVERRCGFEQVRNGKTEANLMTANVEPLSCERKHVAIMIRWNPKCTALPPSHVSGRTRGRCFRSDTPDALSHCMCCI